MEIKSSSKISTEILLKLTEEEARALYAIIANAREIFNKK